MSVTVHPISSKKEKEEFIQLQWELYKNDPHWIPPLKIERREHLDPKKNPFFEHAEVQLFLARDAAGRPVGRISAQLNFEHDKLYGPGTGFFGLFESRDDPAVAAALFRAAEGWCKERRCQRVRGPFSFSINDECGLLVEGFEYPPYMFMAHNPAYYPALVEGQGYTKIKDLYAWRYHTGELNDFTREIAESVEKTPGLVVRDVDMKNLERDVRIVLDIFNSAWSKNWGYVQLTEKELVKLSNDLKLLAEPRLIKIAEYEGKPAAIMLAMPNLNEVIKDLNGELFPTGIFKLLWRVKRKKFTTARLILLGIKKEFRGGVFSGGSLSVLLYVKAHQASKELGHTGGELGWTLEDNEKINQGIELMGGQRYKIYRLYEKEL